MMKRIGPKATPTFTNDASNPYKKSPKTKPTK